MCSVAKYQCYWVPAVIAGNIFLINFQRAVTADCWRQVGTLEQTRHWCPAGEVGFVRCQPWLMVTPTVQ